MLPLLHTGTTPKLNSIRRLAIAIHQTLGRAPTLVTTTDGDTAISLAS